MKKRILIMFGGYSTEYYVSCNSAKGILEHTDKNLFEVMQLGITIEGKWILTEATPEEIGDGITWLNNINNKSAMFSMNRNKNELLVFEKNSIKKVHIDCVFSVIHGHGGEDGCIQGLLETVNIPYVGSGVAASANSIDKQLTRIFAERCHLKQPRCIVLKKEDYEKESFIKDMNLGYPVFVKPASLGSSVGINKVDDKNLLDTAIEEAFEYENKILIEEGIIGSEIKVAVIGNSDLMVGEICELKMPENAINDYATKYIKGSSIKIIPARINSKVKKEAVRQACAIYKELDCKGFARVDFFLSQNNELYFNEINTVPGISKKSIFTLMFEEYGVTYTELITKLINLAFENKKQVKDIEDGFLDKVI